MSDQDNRKGEDKTPRFPKPPTRRESPEDGGGDGGMNWRGMMFITLAILLIVVFIYSRPNSVNAAKEMQYAPDFVNALNEGRIKSAEAVVDQSTGEAKLRGKMLVGDQEREYFLTVNFEFQRELLKELQAKGVGTINVVNSSSALLTSLMSILPLFLVLGVLYFMFRQQLKMAGKGAFSFGKSKGKMITRDKNRILFKDVAGVDEAKEEVQEIVDFLKDPKRFQKLGGRIPKGVLMIGAPGTGKTLLAKAIAGEADVPFFSISGSDFVEMFVGVGASRVRDMFEQGKRNAPCLIFIDEIDAVGRSRGHGVGGGNDEREQTLNALLVEMDGFDTQEGVIIIAATNRKDVLDPALLRPGRFDREVRVPLPDVKGREEILKVHARNVKLAAEVDLSLVARGTPGYSGAELANVINEAALIAAKANKKAIAQGDLEEARDKVRWGRERRSMAMTEEEKKLTAYHEAGHALLSVLLTHCDPLHKVSIIPRGPALGVTMSLPERDRYDMKRKEVYDKICMIMGGRVAEELFLGDVSSGASMDIQQATNYARKMVCEWGMSDKLGMVKYDEQEDHVFLGRDISRGRSFSEETQKEIDHEVRAIIDGSYQRAKDLMSAKREAIEAIVAALLEFETLDGVHIREIIEHGKMITPPRPPTLPAGKAPTIEPPDNKKVVETKPEDDLPGGLTPAPIGV